MIYLGTSGYSYDDWKGVFYPVDLPRQEWLAYYAAGSGDAFGAVELNFTYYRMPTADLLDRIAGQTPVDFKFAVKANQEITHNRKGDPAIFAQFRSALAPLQRQGRLGAVLLQFPYSFDHTAENVAYVSRCVKQLPGLPLVIEFRRKQWLAKRTLALLRERKVGFCNVDMPDLPGLLPRTGFATGPTAYVRLHGRNGEKWWKHDYAWERYDYSYNEEELKEWIPHLIRMEEQAENLFVFANNHWEGQSVTTIRQIKMMLQRANSDTNSFS